MNILIVESENDQYFIEALAKKSENQIWHIDKFEHSNLDEKKLSTKIGSALTTDGVQKIGILLDMDEATEKDRIALINRCLKKAFQDNFDEIISVTLSKTSEFVTVYKDEFTPVQISCFFTNVNEKGELETILKEIAKENAVFANCLLEGWKTCFEEKGKKIAKKGEQGDITEKELLKFWVDVYKRFDTLKKGERNQETTDWKGIWLGYKIKKGDEKIEERGSKIFDLGNEILNDLKIFLALFL
jgi:hypothetical protein